MPAIIRDRGYQCLTPASAHGVRETRRKVLAAKWCKAIDEALSDPRREGRATWLFCLLDANAAIAGEIVELYKAAGWCAFVVPAGHSSNGSILLSEYLLSDDDTSRALAAPAIKLEFAD